MYTKVLQEEEPSNLVLPQMSRQPQVNEPQTFCHKASYKLNGETCSPFQQAITSCLVFFEHCTDAVSTA